MVHDPIYMKCPELAKSIEIESRLVVAMGCRRWRSGITADVFWGDCFFWGDESIIKS